MADREKRGSLPPLIKDIKGAMSVEEVNAIDPQKLVGEGATVTFSGTVWKLNSDGDPRNPDHWLLRRMWLTDQGVLQYFSKKTNSPLGRPVTGLRTAKVSNQEYAKAFPFEIHPPALGGAGGETLPPTTLATETEEHREEWLKALEKYQEEGLMPVISTGRRHHHGEGRKRLNVFSMAHESSQEMSGKIKSSITIKPYGRPSTAERARKAEPAQPIREGIRRNSQTKFASKEQTALILDWDDTIFPTTWVREDLRLNWRYTIDWQLEPGETRSAIEKLLKKLGDKMDEFLSTACNNAQVVVVTLARRPWVQQSCQNFMPDLWKVVEKYNIDVVYAQEGIDNSMQKEYAKDEFKSSEQMEHFWSRVKGAAIAKEVEKIYSKYPGQSWKNVISIGDSEFERWATQLAVTDYVKERLPGNIGCFAKDGVWTAEETDSEGHYRRVRSKTWKLLDEPTVEEMIAEGALMKEWIMHIIAKDEGFDVELENTEDDSNLQVTHRMLTGSEPPGYLSWATLAEMEHS